MPAETEGGARYPALAAGSREYLAYYGLLDAPFRTDADLGGRWFSKSQKEVLAALTGAIRRGGSISLLTGDVATGKTSLVNWLVEMVAGGSLIAGRVANPLFELGELSETVARAFGIGERFENPTGFATRFREFLATADAAGQHVLLVVDEVQSLGDEVLRKLVDLSAIGAFEGHPMALLLVGQTEFLETLAREEHEGLRQRIAVRAALEPLTHDEVGAYIASRLETAGARAGVFDPEALRLIASISRGAPGVVNVICARAIVVGHARRAREIDRAIVDACLVDLGAPAPPPEDAPLPSGARDARRTRAGRALRRETARPGRRARLWVGALTGVGAAAAGYVLSTAPWSPLRIDGPPALIHAAPVEPPRATPSPPPEPPRLLFRRVRGGSGRAVGRRLRAAPRQRIPRPPTARARPLAPGHSETRVARPRGPIRRRPAARERRRARAGGLGVAGRSRRGDRLAHEAVGQAVAPARAHAPRTSAQTAMASQEPRRLP